MSVWQTKDPACSSCAAVPAIATIIDAQARDLGGFQVRRLLPSEARPAVGPFVFFDHMGPALFAPGTGIDVRPHPHIGLETVTYLFQGEIVHRDSLGSHQPIRPGEINWMTAGQGIVHSERTSPELRRTGSHVHGLQLWLALPRTHESVAPAFRHHAAGTIPAVDHAGAHLRVVAGTAYGATSPVRTFSPLFYVDMAMPAGCELPVMADYEERAAYVVEGTITCGPERVPPGRMLVFTPGAEVHLRALSDARVVLVGGAPLDGPRLLWWNFVASSPDRMEQAKADWKAGRFPKVPGDEHEFIPLPA